MNPLKSQYKYKDHLEPLRRVQYELLQKLLVRAEVSADYYSILAPNCSTGQDCDTEKRKAQWVQFYINLLTVSTDVANFPDIRECSINLGGNYVLLDPEQ